MARANRSGRWWFGGLVVAAVVALTLTLVRSCASDEAMTAEPSPAPPTAATQSVAVVESESVRSRDTPRQMLDPPQADDLSGEPESRALWMERSRRIAAQNEELRVEVSRLRVTALRANGSVAAAATVVAITGADDGWQPGLSCAVADAAGRVVFERADRVVRLVAWLGDEAATECPVRASPITLRLSPAVRLRGRVAAQSGDPIPGADVRVSLHRGRAAALVLGVRADSSGYFELPPLPDDEVGLSDGADVEARAPGRPVGGVVVDVEQLRRGVLIQLEPGFTVSGRLLGAVRDPRGWFGSRDGRITVRAVGTAFAAQVGDDGRFELVLPVRAVQVAVLREVIPAVDLSGSRDKLTLVQQPLGTFDGANGDVDLGDVEFRDGAPAGGVAVDPDGNPIDWGEATLSCGGVELGTVKFGSGGRFQSPQVGASPCELVVREILPEREEESARSVKLSGVRGGDRELRVVVSGAQSIVLRLLGEATREPVGAAEVEVRATQRGAPESAARRHCWGQIDAVRVDLPRAGSYDVLLDVRGYEPASYTAIEVFADRETKLDVLLRKKPN